MKFFSGLICVVALTTLGPAFAKGGVISTPQPKYRYEYTYVSEKTGAKVGYRVYQCNGFIIEWGVLEGVVEVEKTPCP